MRHLYISLLLVTACADGGDSSATFPETGSYASQYRVPTPDNALAPAAVYPVEEVDWTVVGDTVTLHYDLPEGLVGGDVDVRFTGTLDGSDTIAITGENGTGSCTVASAIVTCTEDFTNLGTLPISMAVVEQRAMIEYPASVEQRRQLATLFGSDPIGIVEIDSARPVVDDKGGDD